MALSTYKLFQPLTLDDDLVLNNRIVLPPMTRSRADTVTGVPHKMTGLYYAQRTSAGLLITEAVMVSPQGSGWYGAPGIYTDEQEAGWKRVVESVHKKGGKIFLQLQHMGRRAHSSFNNGEQVVSASDLPTPDDGLGSGASGGRVPFETPRALETHEILVVVEQIRSAAERAKRAGFDGVEVHGANGYLVDQFLQSVTNQRTDTYGGSVENRARFLVEVVDALMTVYPPSRIAVRLSPNGSAGGMGSPDNFEQFIYTIQQLGQRKIAFIDLLEATDFGMHDKCRHITPFDVKQAFGGVVITGGGYTRDTAEGVVRSGAADAVAIGRPYLSNPDLVERYQNDWPLAETAAYEFWWDASKGEEGLATYPLYQA